MRRQREGGFALVAVLWILVLVGAIAGALLADARAERRGAANARATTQVRWAARAGLARALYQVDTTLTRSATGFALGVDSTALPFVEFGVAGVAVRVVALDARARVNLNLADATQLRRLLVALGVDSKEGSSLANAVLDWRDSDQVRRPNGAEVGDYAALRPPSRPKDAPFDRVAEIATVLGMTPSIYHRAASHLTVAGDGRVNANSAPAPVLLTLPGMDAAAAAVVVSRRQKGPYRNVFELVASLPREAQERIQADMGTFTDRVAFGPREIEIVVTARAPGTPVGASLRARVELSGGSTWRVLQVNELSGGIE